MHQLEICSIGVTALRPCLVSASSIHCDAFANQPRRAHGGRSDGGRSALYRVINERSSSDSRKPSSSFAGRQPARAGAVATPTGSSSRSSSSTLRSSSTVRSIVRTTIVSTPVSSATASRTTGRNSIGSTVPSISTNGRQRPSPSSRTRTRASASAITARTRTTQPWSVTPRARAGRRRSRAAESPGLPRRPRAPLRAGRRRCSWSSWRGCRRRSRGSRAGHLVSAREARRRR